MIIFKVIPVEGTITDYNKRLYYRMKWSFSDVRFDF